MTANSSVKSANPNFINIISLNGKVYDISPMCTVFSYYEDIDKPFLVATLQVIDSGANLIKTLPIQGGEEVEIEFNAPSGNSGNPTI